MSSIENVTGTEYPDFIAGNARANSLSGGVGWAETPRGDVIGGRGGADRIHGLGGRDRLYGGRGADAIFGGTGNDRLRGGLGVNQNDGGKGTDSCQRPRQGRSALRCER